MTESTENLQSCPACQAVMDVTELEPLTQVECPSCGQVIVVSPMLAHYELVKEVGRGGMGVVYKARDTGLDRMVALKVLRMDHSLDAELVAQLETEAAITASINHPHVVRVFTTGTDAGRFYIAMELVDKGTLDSLIELQGQVAEAQVLEIAIQIAQGLRAAYQHGLIHRDVKPGNILFSDSHTAKIVDFGLAMLEASAVGGGEIWGTPYYVAPEKLDQKPEDFRSDMYSLGATLFHALAGRPPFEAENATLVALKHLKSQAVSLQAFAPHISGSTAYVINKTLLKDPDQRYASYDEFIEHLEYARAELEKKGTQPQAQKRVVLETEEEQKLWSYITFGMLGLVAVVGLGAWWYMSSPKDSGAPTATPVAPATVASGANAGDAKKYESARQQLLAGKTAEAAEAFKKLGRDKKTPSPMAQWSMAHAGLAELLAGRPADASAAFAALQSREMAARGLQDTELGDFFRELASFMGSDRPVPLPATTNFSRENYEVFVSLVAGLKNWQLSEYDDAGAQLRQYQSASPRGEFSWLADYKPLISDYLADFSDYRGALEMVKTAETPKDQQRVIESITAMTNTLRTKGRLAERFTKIKQELVELEAVRQNERAKKLSADRGAMDAERTQIEQLSLAWRFADARKVLTNLPLESEQIRNERSGLLNKIDALIGWRNGLIEDLSKTGIKTRLQKKDGTELTNPIVKAGEAGVDFQGIGTVAWSDFAPKSLLATAASNATTGNRNPLAVAERWWQAGVFAAMNGLNAEAERFLIGAARARPEYVPALPLLLPSARPGEENIASGAKATASDFVKNAQFNEEPGMAFDGNLETKWCAKAKGPKWLQADLGEEKTITAWIVRHAHTGGESEKMNTAEFELQASLDGKTWATLDRVSGNTAAVTKRLIVPTRTRYARLAVKKPSQSATDPVARIPEFELRGTSTPATADLARSFFEPVEWFASPQLISHDISTTRLGSADIDWKTGEIEVSGAGVDIWGPGDSFQFAFHPLQADGQIVAQIIDVKNTHEWAKAGLMFRENSEGNSKNVFFGISATGKLTLQNRETPASMSTSMIEPDHPAPIWLKLVRQGDKFTSSYSSDGIKWQEYKSATVPMSGNLQVGLAVSSHVPEELCTTRFDNVRITQTTPADPVKTTGPGNGVQQTKAQPTAAAGVP